MASNMKKVYITSLHMMHGGIEMAITLLANALVKRNYDVEILCTYNLGTPVYQLDDKVKITYLTDVKPNKKEIKEAIRSKNPIAIVKQGLYAAKVLFLKQKTLEDKIKTITEGCIVSTRNEHSVILSKYGHKNIKKIAQLHHDHCFDKKLIKDFRQNYKNIDVFILLTEWLRTEIQEMMKENTHTKLVVVPNFLPEIEVTTNIERENQVIAVGRLHEVKGFLRMLDIWATIKTNEAYILKIVGDGEEYDAISKKIQELGLEKRVILAGAMEHSKVLEEMGKSKVYLMTSYTEAFPFVLIEAMSKGLPMVAYDVRVGPRAMIDDSQNGYLVEDGNVELFKNKLEHILNDDIQCEKMSRNSLAKAACFTEEVVMKQWISILEE